MSAVENIIIIRAFAKPTGQNAIEKSAFVQALGLKGDDEFTLNALVPKPESSSMNNKYTSGIAEKKYALVENKISGGLFGLSGSIEPVTIKKPVIFQHNPGFYSSVNKYLLITSKDKRHAELEKYVDNCVSIREKFEDNFQIFYLIVKKAANGAILVLSLDLYNAWKNKIINPAILPLAGVSGGAQKRRKSRRRGKSRQKSKSRRRGKSKK